MVKNRQSRIGLAVVAVLMVCACWAQADIPAFVDYHATWAKDPGSGDGYWDVNDPSYGYPEWQVTGQPPFTYPTGQLKVPNQPDPDRVKEVWVEIEWEDPVMVPETPPSITLSQPTSGVTTLVTAPTASGMGYTWQWVIEPQPAEEWLQMSPYMQALQGIATVEVGTFCATTTVHKPQILYGTLDQSAVGPNTCGPTSTANSFAYLERAYPEVYSGRKLIPDIEDKDDYGPEELKAVADELKDLMKHTDTNGVYVQGMIDGKIKYIEAHAPDTTVVGAQIKYDWDTQKPQGIGDIPDRVQENTEPTWEWLKQQLLSCEDVEILIRPVGGGLGHFVTLTGMTWQDDGDGDIEPGEATIDYIDPNGGPGQSPVTYNDDDEELRLLQYKGQSVNFRLEAAVKESIPEPATMTLLVLGGLAVLRRRRRSR